MKFILLPAIAVSVGFLAALAGAADPPQRPTPDDIKKMEAAAPEKAPAAPKKARKILIYTKCTGFPHSAVPVGAKCFEILGRKSGAWESVITDDENAFAADNLKNFDAVVLMNTTGELLVPKGAKADDPKVVELRTAFMNFVKSGKGVVGIHAATDCSYKWKEFGEMMGGYFAGHPFGKITLYIDDPKNPVNACFEGKPFEISDEIYTFREPYSRDRLHLLTSSDVIASKWEQGFNRKDNDYAVSWLNKHGEGRVFYCSFGHREEVFWNPVVLQHYLAGTQFALGDLEADAKPSGPMSAERLEAYAKIAAAAWQNVCSNEKWYRDEKIKEQVFTGTLEAIPDAGGPGIVMRTSYYKLGDRNIFTSGKKLPVLDGVVGKKVDLKGKPYDMNLEGKAISEIWPAQVRPAK